MGFSSHNDVFLFFCSGNGASVSSVQIVKLGLAVLDRLLIKNKEAEMSLLESKVCDAWALHNSSESQFFRPFESSFVSNIAKYIYHEDDPKLATLAMVVLQRICFINSVSIIACFGSDAFSLRRAIVSCLESNTKPVRLKVAILEFLTCAVDKQPGLLELFINHQLQTGEESLKSKKTFGKPSCLPAVLNYLAVKVRILVFHFETHTTDTLLLPCLMATPPSLSVRG
ncbi:nucleoporin NUP188-like isoform X1 [Rhopilema esculentum]|uniref:nucleoporin NUP188-like isoform X1 n=1 Tax=Rhopilema esculentum TaxID=499914 RepID=UPI0031E31625